MTTWSGSERCVEEMLAVLPAADLVVGVVAPSLRARNEVTRCARETWLARIPGASRHHRWFLPLEALAFATLDTRGYDLIVSSSHSLSKIVASKNGAPHVCYCYSPPRYLWDLYNVYMAHAGGVERFALRLGAGAMRWVDRRAARRVDHFVCISSHVAQRV